MGLLGRYNVKVGLEKNTKKEGEAPAEVPSPADYPEIVRATAEALGQQVVVVMAVYMALDTLRKVVIKTTKAG